MNKNNNVKSIAIPSKHIPSSSSKVKMQISLKDLEVLNKELQTKDDEYILVIKGKKQLLINEKRKQNDLDKKIEALKREINDCRSSIVKDHDDNVLNLNYIHNELDYNNSIYEVKSNAYKRKINEEEQKQYQLKLKINSINNNLHQYKSLINTFERDNALLTPDILKATEEMQKFLSEL